MTVHTHSMNITLYERTAAAASMTRNTYSIFCIMFEAHSRRESKPFNTHTTANPAVSILNMVYLNVYVSRLSVFNLSTPRSHHHEI